MATVTKRTQNGKVTWLVRWVDPAGRQRKKSWNRKTDADRHLTNLSHSLLTGAYVDPSSGRVTVGEWAQHWLATQVHLKESTLDGYRSLLRCHVEPVWGTTPLGAVTHSAVGGWVASLTASGLSASRVRHAHRVLSLILASAVKDQRIVRNPADDVNLPRIRRKEKRFLTHAEVAALADAAGRDRLIVLVLAYCGLRFGELAALRAQRVDLMRRRIHVTESVTEVGAGLAWSDPKRYRSRSVPIPRFIADQLAVHLAGKAPDDLVFTAAGGGVLRNRNFRGRYFDRAAAAIGMPGLTPHEMRHTAASLAIADGADAGDVQTILGHRSAAMTLDVYRHQFKDRLDDVADRLDRSARAAQEMPSREAFPGTG